VKWKYLQVHPLANKVKHLKIDKNPISRFLDLKEEKLLLKALYAREATIRSERDSANDWRRARGYKLLPDLKEIAYGTGAQSGGSRTTGKKALIAHHHLFRQLKG